MALPLIVGYPSLNLVWPATVLPSVLLSTHAPSPVTVVPVLAPSYVEESARLIKAAPRLTGLQSAFLVSWPRSLIRPLLTSGL